MKITHRRILQHSWDYTWAGQSETIRENGTCSYRSVMFVGKYSGQAWCFPSNSGRTTVCLDLYIADQCHVVHAEARVTSQRGFFRVVLKMINEVTQ